MRNFFMRFRQPKQVLGVTPGAFDEIAGKLAAAGIGAVQQDGSLDLSKINIARDENATLPPRSAAGHPPGYRPINPKKP